MNIKNIIKEELQNFLNEEDAYDIDPSELSPPIDRKPLHQAAVAFDNAAIRLHGHLDAHPELQSKLRHVQDEVRRAASGARVAEGEINEASASQCKDMLDAGEISPEQYKACLDHFEKDYSEVEDTGERAMDEAQSAT